MASCAQEKFLKLRVLSIAFCVGALLLNASMWAAKPDSDTEWKPPKLPEAVTMKPDGAALNVVPIDRGARSDIEQAAAQIDSILEAYWNENSTKDGNRTSDPVSYTHLTLPTTD